MSKKMIYASPKGEKIVFDNWTENEEFEGLWVDLCPECLSKYQDIWTMQEVEPQLVLFTDAVTLMQDAMRIFLQMKLHSKKMRRKLLVLL